MQTKQPESHSFNHVFRLELIALRIRRTSRTINALIKEQLVPDTILKHLSAGDAAVVAELNKQVHEKIKEAKKLTEAAEESYRTASSTPPSKGETVEERTAFQKAKQAADLLSDLEKPIKYLREVKTCMEWKEDVESERQRLEKLKDSKNPVRDLADLNDANAKKIKAVKNRLDEAVEGVKKAQEGLTPKESSEQSHSSAATSEGDGAALRSFLAACPPSPYCQAASEDGAAALMSLRTQALEMDLVGLSLSGGGIRSATFALGVLQGLANLRLLGCFDYLSTVSGGGYVGAWLSAWIQREGSLTNVERQLDPSRLEQSRADRQVQKKDANDHWVANPLHEVVNDEPEPIHHLRAYSRYLTPRPGLLSADTWAIFSIYLRNLLINQLIIVPAILALVLASRLLVLWFAVPVAATSLFAPSTPVWSFSLLYAVFTLAALWFLYDTRTRQYQAARHPDVHHKHAESSIRYMRFTLWSLIASAICGLWIFSLNPGPFQGEPSYPKVGLRFLGYAQFNELVSQESSVLNPLLGMIDIRESKLRLLTLLTFIVIQALLLPAFSLARFTSRLLRALIFKSKSDNLSWSEFWRILLLDSVRGACLGLFLGLALWLCWRISYPANTHALVTLGVPLILAAIILTGYAELALLGWMLDEYEREWRSYLSAYLLIHAIAWLVFFGTTLYIPPLIALVVGSGPWRTALGTTLTGAWAVISSAGAWLGHRARLKRSGGISDTLTRLLTTIAPVVFLAGLLALVSMLAKGLATGDWSLETFNPRVNWERSAAVRLWILLAVAVVGTVWFAFSINVNHFSLHMLYGNRLTRCYLGASRRKQKWSERVQGPVLVDNKPSWDWMSGSGGAPTNVADNARRDNQVTGFDPADDLKLRQLRLIAQPETDSATADQKPSKPYDGPFLLVNAALNLVAGTELATQDRKAESFVLTPDFFGSPLTGYEAITPENSEFLSLGRVMTVSGAAVDPNMGYMQSAPLTALLTVLNFRLGLWIRNPRMQTRHWLWSKCQKATLLARELFGLTDERQSYIHLSDGGHFENLGVYELIRRRCHFIVVTDADTDDRAASTNLANLLRLIRTDFGIRIDIDLSLLERKEPGGWSKWHCAVGLIRYDDVDETAVAGVLVYVRASLTGNEPPDVLRYAAAHPAFPRQTTADQFFDEAQFESYRALGYHIAQEVFAAATQRRAFEVHPPQRFQGEIRRLFTRVRRHWFPRPPEIDRHFVETALSIAALETKLRADEHLLSFCRELYPELGESQHAAELHMVIEMLRLMEAAWSRMNLADYHAHPVNRGWMNLFRRWTASPTFHRFWPFLRAQFSREFVIFCQRALNLRPIQIDAHRLELSGSFDEVEALNHEFNQEWLDTLVEAGAHGLEDHVADLVRAAVLMAHDCSLDKPFVWLLSLRASDSDLTPRPCGIVCAAPSSLCNRTKDPDTALELFVWLRGPYRNLGLGRKEPIRDLLYQIGEELRNSSSTYTRLLSFYPKLGVNNAERLEKAMWMNFFFDINFRNANSLLNDPELRRNMDVLSLNLQR